MHELYVQNYPEYTFFIIACGALITYKTMFVDRYNRSNFNSRSDSNSDCPSDSELKGSMDIHPDMDFGWFDSSI